MDTSPNSTLVLAGRPIEQARDYVRRYCGLSWGGGPAETWAFRYYDVVESDPTEIGPVDVLAAAALHPGLSRADLAYFHDRVGDLTGWLGEVPTNTSLTVADDSLLGHLDQLSSWEPAPTVTLLSKVLHRKRPELIPLVDRHVIDRYRPITGERAAQAAWQPLLRQLRIDLEKNQAPLDRMSKALEVELERCVSHLRLLDIAVWMDGRK